MRTSFHEMATEFRMNQGIMRKKCRDGPARDLLAAAHQMRYGEQNPAYSKLLSLAPRAGLLLLWSPEHASRSLLQSVPSNFVILRPPNNTSSCYSSVMATAQERHPQVYVEKNEDPWKRHRIVPMEVLSLGMSRTGTMSTTSWCILPGNKTNDIT